MEEGTGERFSIIHEILKSANKSMSKEILLYNTPADRNEAIEYLDFLTKCELLEYSNGKYTTTKRGHEFLESYERLEKYLVNENDFN